MTAVSTNARLESRPSDARSDTGAGIRRLVAVLGALFARRPADPADALARAERREAARRAVDTLLLR